MFNNWRCQKGRAGLARPFWPLARDGPGPAQARPSTVEGRAWAGPEEIPSSPVLALKGQDWISPWPFTGRFAAHEKNLKKFFFSKTLILAFKIKLKTIKKFHTSQKRCNFIKLKYYELIQINNYLVKNLTK